MCLFRVFQLLRRNPDRRLGSSERDAEDVKRQAFFRVRILLGPLFVGFIKKKKGNDNVCMSSIL